MDGIRDFFHLITTVEGITQIISWGGLLILFAIVFAETGLLVGFFLPGDSLLVTAGFVAATQPEVLDIRYVVFTLWSASMLGDSTGYLIGRRAGVALYAREQSRWFQRDKLLRTKEFYEKYGRGAVILARFVPFARTFAPVVSGIAEMPYRSYFPCTVIGGFLWTFGVTLLGYYFGQIPFVKHHLEKVIILVILLSVSPIIIHGIKARREHAAAQDEAA